MQNPDKYFDNNREKAARFFSTLNDCGVQRVVFSSTAAVYGESGGAAPIVETQTTQPINPYGQSKLDAEQFLRSVPGINSVSLRYFNVAGAAPDAGLGEAHKPESHLIPRLLLSMLALDPPPNPPPKGGGLSTAHAKVAIHTHTELDIENARRLRREMTKPERILWKKLRELPQELGVTFRRQHPVHPYILDFACIKIKLAIETDGMSHDNEGAQNYDEVRTNNLRQKGYTVLRFLNDDILKDCDAVMATIMNVCTQLQHERREVLPPWGEGWVGGQRNATFFKSLSPQIGIEKGFTIYGDDYPTPDGTAIRDYVHVMDLIDAHLKALTYLLQGGSTNIFNLGSGKGFSVKEIVDVAKTVLNQSNFQPPIVPRRAGDGAFLVASHAKAQKILGWQPQRTLPTIIQDAVRWHQSEHYRDAMRRNGR